VLGVPGHPEPVVVGHGRGVGGGLGVVLPGRVPAGPAGYPGWPAAGRVAVPGAGDPVGGGPGPGTARLAAPPPAATGGTRGSVGIATAMIRPPSPGTRVVVEIPDAYRRG